MSSNSSIFHADQSPAEAPDGPPNRAGAPASERIRFNASSSWPRLTLLGLLALAAAGLLALAAASGACSQNDSGGSRPPRTVFSSKEFSQGLQDGRRDAERSLFDDHAGWTWLWMMGEDYTTGYEQGWREVRTHMRLRAEQEEARRRHEEDQQNRPAQQEDPAG